MKPLLLSILLVLILSACLGVQSDVGEPPSEEIPPPAEGADAAASDSGASEAGASDAGAPDNATDVDQEYASDASTQEWDHYVDGWTPLGDAVADLEPNDVWEDFYQLTQIPRPSHHEQAVSAVLSSFGESLGLETIVDDTGNVLIRRPASPGMEDRPGVVLQAHMDMVPQKSKDSDHDFETDPIDAYVVGDWVTADGTTLGADDGIGAALIMGALASTDLKAGPLEGLFTVNEEDGLGGARGLAPGVLQGTILINIDQETEGWFLIGCAGGRTETVEATYEQVPLPAGYSVTELTIEGLAGGHSGLDIDKGRANAAMLMAELLAAAAQDFDLRLAELQGGTARNAIPREASALVALPSEDVDELEGLVADLESKWRSEYAAAEPDLSASAAMADPPEMVMDSDAATVLISTIAATPQGVIAMDPNMPEFVQTSTNLGVVMAQDGSLELKAFSRSSSDSGLADVVRDVESAWSSAGYDVELGEPEPGWAPNPDSPLLELMTETYADLFGHEPKAGPIHAGLECGLFEEKYPGLDMISIGPTLLDVHTTNERLEAATVGQVQELLYATLERIPAASDEPG